MRLGVESARRRNAKVMDVPTLIATSLHWRLVSVGIGGNALLAKLANRKAKPAGSFHLREEDAISHIDLLPIDRLPGFAYSAKQKIAAKWNINTCGGVWRLGSVEVLQKVLGPATGEKLLKYVRGIDDRDLTSEEPRKSLSASVKVHVPSMVPCPSLIPT